MEKLIRPLRWIQRFLIRKCFPRLVQKSRSKQKSFHKDSGQIVPERVQRLDCNRGLGKKKRLKICHEPLAALDQTRVARPKRVLKKR